MSYILDALRRAERDRKQTQNTPVEQLALSSQTPATPPSRRRLVLIGLIVLAVCAGLAVLGDYLWRSTQGQTVAQTASSTQPFVLIPAGESTPAPPQPAPMQEPHTVPHVVPQEATASAVAHPASRPAPATARKMGTINPIADAGSLSNLSQLLPPKPAPKVQQRKNTVRQTIQSASALNPTEATQTGAVGQSKPSTETVSGAASISPQSAASTAPAAASTATSSQAGPTSRNLKAMPDSYRANFPQVTVQVHVYDPDPAKCWVMIDGRRYKQGGTLPQGPKIYKIVPSGIVFDYRGQRVLYPTGD